MADRALNIAGGTMAALMPLVLGLAVACVQPVPVQSVLVLWVVWLLALVGISYFLLRPVRVPTKRGLR